MSNQTPKTIIMKWINAYNNHNPDIISLYDPNITNIQFPWGKSVQGQEAIRNTYINLFKSFPDIHVEVKNIVEEAPWVVLEWNISGTMKGEFAGHAPNNNSFNMHGCEIFKIVKGKILIQHGYWDKATMFTQLKINIKY